MLYLSDGNIIKEGTVSAKNGDSSHQYRDIIEPVWNLSKSEKNDIYQAIAKKQVDIIVGDAFLHRMFSIRIAVGLIKELRNIYTFNIESIEFQIRNNRRQCNNRDWTIDSYASQNFDSEARAEEYIEDDCKKILGIIPTISDTLTHHRFLLIKTEDGYTFEIRPDHGFGGGWRTNIRFKNVEDNKPISFRRFPSEEVIKYYFLLKRRDNR